MSNTQQCQNPILADCNWPSCVCGAARTEPPARTERAFDGDVFHDPIGALQRAWASGPLSDKPPEPLDEIREAAQELVEWATTLGFVLTIEQRPLHPLAMGHYESVVSVRPARGAPTA